MTPEEKREQLRDDIERLEQELEWLRSVYNSLRPTQSATAKMKTVMADGHMSGRYGGSRAT